MVNVAARIESVSEPGVTLVSSQIRFHLDDDAVEDAGTFSLRGVEEPQELYRLRN